MSTRTVADLDWPVRTARLLIRPSTAADAEGLFAYHSDPATAEWLSRHIPDPAEWAEWFAQPEVLEKTLVVERDGEIVGDLFLRVQDAWAQREVADGAKGTEAEIGWALAPAARGQGYAREGVEALLAVCFEGLGLRRVTAGCFAVNEPSWRLMERLGMRREAYTVKDALHREHGWMDGMTYALLAEEWAARRGTEGDATA